MEFEKIFGRTINHISFGEDVIDDKFDFLILTIKDEEWIFTETRVSLIEAIHNMTFITFKSGRMRMMNPITGALELLFDIQTEMGSFFRNLRDNAARLRREISKYVQKRKSGAKGTMQGYDLVTVFLENQEMFSDEAIIENLLALIFAATETSQYTMQTIIGHLAQSGSKQSLEKLRREFTDSILKPAIEEDPSIEKLS